MKLKKISFGILSINDFDASLSPIIINDVVTYGRQVQCILLHLYEEDGKDPNGIPPIVLSLHKPRAKGKDDEIREVNAIHIANAI